MQAIENILQGTPEWLEARRCKITGTKLEKVMGSDLDRFNLIAELIAEKGTELSKLTRPTEEMERGSELEVFGRKLFEKKTSKIVKEVGICISDEFDWVTLSPDGLIMDANGKYSEAVEIKSPNSATLIKYKMANMIRPDLIKLSPSKQPFLGIPAEYKWQVVHYFIVNPDLRKLHFVAYDERFIDLNSKLYIVEVNWENELLQEAIYEAKKALVGFRELWLYVESIILPVTF